MAAAKLCNNTRAVPCWSRWLPCACPSRRTPGPCL